MDWVRIGVVLVRRGGQWEEEEGEGGGASNGEFPHSLLNSSIQLSKQYIDL